MQWRYATRDDSKLLAVLNRQLIVVEGHHNSMGLPELEERMHAWLDGEYRAVLFHRRHDILAYALYRPDEWDRIHVRQFLVVNCVRRQGVGREALTLFRRDVVPPGKQVILEVLTGNRAARAFYAACGFREYAVTLLSDPDLSPTGGSGRD